MGWSAGWLGGGAWFALVVTALPAESLRLATYNLENYGAADRMTEAGFRRQYPKPEAEKQAVRRVIRGLRADVLILQEVGGAAYLQELQRDLATEGAAYPHAALGEGPDEERRLAILSRRPLVDVISHRDLDFAYLGGRERVKRGLLEATIATTAGPVAVFAVHLKSRFTDRADDPLSATRRSGEAGAIRDRILRRIPAIDRAWFVILGDCNDGRTSRALGRLQKRGEAEVCRLLPARDSRGEVWTHAFRREETYSRVDHVLVSLTLWTHVDGRAARIFDGAGVADASDHRPVLVDLSLP